MKARELIASARCAPDKFRLICQAFDEVWREIEDNFSNNAQEIEQARLHLAGAILFAASKKKIELSALKATALKAMTLQYGSKKKPPPIAS